MAEGKSHAERGGSAASGGRGRYELQFKGWALVWNWFCCVLKALRGEPAVDGSNSSGKNEDGH